VNHALAENPTAISFLDESSPQNSQTQSVWGHETKGSYCTTNTQRLWSFAKPATKKNTTSLKANAFCFYAIKGNNVVDFK